MYFNHEKHEISRNLFKPRIITDEHGFFKPRNVRKKINHEIHEKHENYFKPRLITDGHGFFLLRNTRKILNHETHESSRKARKSFNANCHEWA